MSVTAFEINGNGKNNGSTDGQIINTCHACYDPTVDNKCGVNANFYLKSKLTEKIGAWDAGYTHEIVPVFMPDPSIIASISITCLSTPSASILNSSWGDMYQNASQFFAGFTVKKHKKINNKLHFELIAPSLTALNNAFNAINSTPSGQFITLDISGNKDFHLYKPFISVTKDVSTLQLTIDYDLFTFLPNLTFLFWQYYNIKKGDLLNKVDTIVRTCSILTRLLPLQEIEYQMVLTFNNSCLPITIKKKIIPKTVDFGNPIPIVTFETIIL